VFLTGPEFLPELRAHRGRTLTLIDQPKPPLSARIGCLAWNVLDLDFGDHSVQVGSVHLQHPAVAEIEQLRARHQVPPASAVPPERQRASDASLLRRLEAATERIRRLEQDNRELRDALAQALGEQRTSTILGPTPRRDTPNRNRSKLIGRLTRDIDTALLPVLPGWR
jgi:hypothetical protein